MVNDAGFSQMYMYVYSLRKKSRLYVNAFCID